MKPNMLLIDGDLYAYKYSAVAEQAIDWGDGNWTYHADAGVAFANMKADIDHALVALKAEKIVICLSDDGRSFRKTKVYPEYKSNRKDVRKPMCLAQLKQMMVDNYETRRKDWLEADDVMGIIMTNPLVYPDYDKIIVSRDKDMLSVPGVVWQEKYDEKGKPIIHYVTEAQADERHLTQTLTGDTADGYPGCPKVGPVGAAKIVPGGWPAVLAEFIKRGKTEEFALSQARCARILRATDFDYNKQEPILWTPQPSIPTDVYS
jgi:DNA polymerase-1